MEREDRAECEATSGSMDPEVSVGEHVYCDESLLLDASSSFNFGSSDVSSPDVSLKLLHQVYLLKDFFDNDTSWDYNNDINDVGNTSLLFLLCNDKSNNYYLRLFQPNNLNYAINGELLFLKINKVGLSMLLMDRSHINVISDTCKDTFMTIGSLNTGKFDPIEKILINYKKSKVNFVYIYWIRFQIFRSYTLLSFCDQIFYVCIIRRNETTPYNRWSLLNPKKSKLLNSFNLIGPYGISGMHQEERKSLNSYISDEFESKYSFGPTNMSLENKQKCIFDVLPDSDGVNLVDKFIENFTPYLFDNKVDAEEQGKKYWSRKTIFNDTQLLFNGKVHGIFVNVTETFSERIMHHTDTSSSSASTYPTFFHLLSGKYYMIPELINKIGRKGVVFIPLIVRNIVSENSTEDNMSVEYSYPDYYYSTDGTIISNELPDITTVNGHLVDIIAFDIYNFIISFFCGIDYLNIVSKICKKDGNGVSETQDLMNCVQYEVNERGKCKFYVWIQVIHTVEKSICIIPIIILVLYYHARRECIGIPLHIQNYFNKSIKIDKCGVITKTGIKFDNQKVSGTQNYAAKKIRNGYLSCYSGNDPLINASIQECNEMHSILALAKSNTSVEAASVSEDDSYDDASDIEFDNLVDDNEHDASSYIESNDNNSSEIGDDDGDYDASEDFIHRAYAKRKSRDPDYGKFRYYYFIITVLC